MTPAMQPVLPEPTLPPGVSLGFCHLDDDRDIDLGTATAWLAPQEQARADRFHFPRDAKRFIRGRGFLRRRLGAALDMAPAEVPLTEGPHKKPEILGQGPGFNLSHSGALLVLALREEGPVGVDLELADRSIDPMALAPTCFVDHEIEALAGMADPAAQLGRFLTFWTAKEALMKLTGQGMYLAPKDIALRLKAGHPVGFDAPQAHRDVRLTCPDTDPGHHLAIAWETS